MYLFGRTSIKIAFHRKALELMFNTTRKQLRVVNIFSVDQTSQKYRLARDWRNSASLLHRAMLQTQSPNSTRISSARRMKEGF